MMLIWQTGSRSHVHTSRRNKRFRKWMKYGAVYAVHAPSIALGTNNNLRLASSNRRHDREYMVNCFGNPAGITMLQNSPWSNNTTCPLHRKGCRVFLVVWDWFAVAEAAAQKRSHGLLRPTFWQFWRCEKQFSNFLMGFCDNPRELVIQFGQTLKPGVDQMPIACIMANFGSIPYLGLWKVEGWACSGKGWSVRTATEWMKFCHNGKKAWKKCIELLWLWNVTPLFTLKWCLMTAWSRCYGFLVMHLRNVWCFSLNAWQRRKEMSWAPSFRSLHSHVCSPIFFWEIPEIKSWKIAMFLDILCSLVEIGLPWWKPAWFWWPT